MDNIQDWAAYILNNANLAHAPYLYRLYTLSTTLRTWLAPLLDQITRKPDLATLALLLVIVLVSLKILDMLWQTLMFWVRLTRRLVFWGGLAALGLWVWSRGPEGVVEDVGFWRARWGEEYGFWKEKERVAKLVREGGGGFGGGQGRAGWF